MSLINLRRDAMGFKKLNETLGQTPKVLTRVAQYSQPIRKVQMVFNHPQQIINLQQQVTDLEMRRSLPPQYDHTELEQQ